MQNKKNIYVGEKDLENAQFILEHLSGIDSFSGLVRYLLQECRGKIEQKNEESPLEKTLQKLFHQVNLTQAFLENQTKIILLKEILLTDNTEKEEQIMHDLKVKSEIDVKKMYRSI